LCAIKSKTLNKKIYNSPQAHNNNECKNAVECVALCFCVSGIRLILNNKVPSNIEYKDKERNRNEERDNPIIEKEEEAD